ncbi:12468_t:CDS:2, partial [Dentiscutata heterogama]
MKVKKKRIMMFSLLCQDVGFPLHKGWALKGNQKLGNKGGTRIKKNIKSMLE